MGLGFADGVAEVSGGLDRENVFPEVPGALTWKEPVDMPGDPGANEKVFVPADPGRDEEVFIPADPGRDEATSEAPEARGPEIPSPAKSDGDVKETEKSGPEDPSPEKSSGNINEAGNPDTKAVEDILKKPEKIKELMDKYPEKAEYFKKLLRAVEILNDENATAVEKNKASDDIQKYKGTLLELAAKCVLAEKGLTVEDKQRNVEGENGATRPDVIAKNNTDKTIRVFGCDVPPGGTISVECKCGRAPYLADELRNHIPNQLSGHEECSVLLTTSDIREVNQDKVNEVCGKNDTTLCVVNVSAREVENAIKEVKT